MTSNISGGFDIVIPLTKDKFNSYYELRMTLRSIEKHLTGYRDIYIVGEKPGWVTNVIHIPAKDLTGKKQFSIYNKLMTAAQNENVSDNFIRWDDDVYLLQHIHISGIKDWNSGTLKDWAHKNINSLYRNVIKNTLQIFPNGLYYDIHAPRIFNKDKYKELIKYPWLRTELLTKSIYFNTYPPDTIIEMIDPKIQKGLFYSTGKMTSQDDRMLRELFSAKSKYEL